MNGNNKPSISDLLDGYDNAIKLDRLKRKLTTGKSLKIKRLFNLRGRNFYPASVVNKTTTTTVSRFTTVKNTALNGLNEHSSTVDQAKLYTEMYYVVCRQKEIKRRAFLENLQQLAMLQAYKASMTELGNGGTGGSNPLNNLALGNLGNLASMLQQQGDDEDDEDDEDFVPSDEDSDEDSDEEEEEDSEEEEDGQNSTFFEALKGINQIEGEQDSDSEEGEGEEFDEEFDDEEEIDEDFDDEEFDDDVDL